MTPAAWIAVGAAGLITTSITATAVWIAWCSHGLMRRQKQRADLNEDRAVKAEDQLRIALNLADQADHLVTETENYLRGQQ